MTNRDSSSIGVVNSSRRQFLSRSALGVVSSSVVASINPSMSFAAVPQDRRSLDLERIDHAFRTRVSAAANQKEAALKQAPPTTNGDEERYRDQNYYASFSKALVSNRYGEVEPNSFRQLTRATQTQRIEDYERITLDPQAAIKLANPMGALRCALVGLDAHATQIRPAPSFRSAESAAEMVELYWQSLARDVAFNHYADDSTIAAAVADLNALSVVMGPTRFGRIDPSRIFRGADDGCIRGPHISQFLWQDIEYGPAHMEQRYKLPVAGVDFLTDYQEWLAQQRGGRPRRTTSFADRRRYIHNARGLAAYVHKDALFQAYFNAALIILGYGPDALDQNNPYLQNNNQGAFTTFGGPFVFELVSQAANLALSGAWFQKWNVHRRLRPEAFGGRVHFHRIGQRDYELHSDLLNSEGLARNFSRYGNFYLSQAYPEGSPTHPSFPAGHAAVAGACATVLKACFNEDYVIENAVEANSDGSVLDRYTDEDLTLGNEINKLAYNITLGRDAAGVHYRSDGEDGLLVGEQQALALLQDSSLSIKEEFAGFQLKTFAGKLVRIVRGEIIYL